MTAATPTVRGLVIAAIAAAFLIATSPPRIVGDGGEYLAQAVNFASLHGPAISRHDIPAIHARIAAASPAMASWDIEAASLPGGTNRRRDFQHFWFYSLAAAPLLWVTDAAGLNPIRAFTLLNCALLGLAIALVLPRLGAIGTLLLFGGPIIWWIDKPHTEVFTVALLSVAILLVRERPAWALAASGLAATQNPPIAALFAAVGVMHVGRAALGTRRDMALRTDFFRRAFDRRILVGGAIGAAGVLLQPVYTYARHGTPSLLLSSTIRGVPTLAELAAVPFDLNVGLLVGFPALLLAVAAATILLVRRRPAAFRSAEVVSAAVVATIFLYAFANTANVHHGGTPGMSRYGLWLGPLAIPLLIEARAAGGRGWRWLLGAITAGSVAFSLWVFYPARPQNWTQPTRLALWVWTHHPTWSNPIPEVFTETLRHDDRPRIPTATDACEKVLLAGDLRRDSVWPVPCAPAPLPAFCNEPGVACYANRAGHDYTFTRAPGRAETVVADPNTWPHDAEPRIRAWYDDRGWWPLLEHIGGFDTLRASFGVRTTAMGSPTRFVLILERPSPDATLVFRLPSAMRGDFLDPRSGTVVGTIRFDGPPGDLWSIGIPAGHDILILDMTETDAR